MAITEIILSSQALDGSLTPAKVSTNPSDNFTFPGALGVGVTPVASAKLQADSTTQGFLPPRMTEAQRDLIVSPATGLQIFNTDSSQPEVFNGIDWTGMGGAGSALFFDDTFTAVADGTGQVFTLAHSAVTNSAVVNHNGLVLRPTTDYTLSGTTLTILENVLTGDSIQAIYAHAVAPATPPAGLDTEIQFNNVGEFGASADLTWTANKLTINKEIVITDLTNIAHLKTTGGELDIFTDGDAPIAIYAGNTNGIYITKPASGEDCIGIGTFSPDASSVLDVVSSNNNRGFLLPRMTTIQRDAIATPATGLLIYNTTTSCLETYNGTGWVLSGNASANMTFDGTYTYTWNAVSFVMPNSDITLNSFDNVDHVFINAGGEVNIYSDSNSHNPSYNISVPANSVNMQIDTIGQQFAIYSEKSIELLPDPTFGVFISHTQGSPDASAILHLSTNSQGFLPPTMTTAEKTAISSPATGLIVYDTDLNFLQEYNGTIWTNVSPAASVAGADTQIQFNNSGAFGASSSLTWNGSNVTIGGGLLTTGLIKSNVITTTSVSYTILTTDYTIIGNATSNNIATTLPAASAIPGRLFNFKKSDATANTVTINRTGSDLIDGQTSVILTTQYQTVTIQSDGTNWNIL